MAGSLQASQTINLVGESITREDLRAEQLIMPKSLEASTKPLPDFLLLAYLVFESTWLESEASVFPKLFKCEEFAYFSWTSGRFTPKPTSHTN